MHLRQAEQGDVIYVVLVIGVICVRKIVPIVVIGVLELLGDLQSLGALVLACPTVQSVAVYVYLHF